MLPEPLDVELVAVAEAERSTAAGIATQQLGVGGVPQQGVKVGQRLKWGEGSPQVRQWSGFR